MIRFAELFRERKIVVSLIRELSWTHFLRLSPIADPLKRAFGLLISVAFRPPKWPPFWTNPTGSSPFSPPSRKRTNPVFHKS
jgi:hypothetical protein